VAISCERGNELLGYLKGVEFLDKLSDYQSMKKGCFMKVVISLMIYSETNS
jgi:hypothetical protein